MKTNQGGFVLIMTFALMITLLLITASFLYMTNARLLGASGELRDAQALWIAEAGLQQGLYSLRTDRAYRASPTTLTASLGEGSYSVTMTQADTVYTITSTGTVNGLSRQLRQSVDVTTLLPDAFAYAVFGDTNGSELSLRNQTTVTGDLYYDGAVEVRNNNTVTGLVYATSVSGGGSYTAATSDPDPIPTYPSLVTTYYDNLISAAPGSVSNVTVKNSDNLDLAGGTHYYNKITIKDSATVTGPGILVAADNVVFKDSSVIGSDVTVISEKKVTAQNSAQVGSGGLFYAKDHILLKNSAIMTGTLIGATPTKEVKFEDSSQFTGLAYGGVIKLRDSATVTGSIAGDSYKQNRIVGTLNITFNGSVLPAAKDVEGIEADLATITVQSDWNEI